MDEFFKPLIGNMFASISPQAQMMTQAMAMVQQDRDTALDRHIRNTGCNVCTTAVASGDDDAKLCVRGKRADDLDKKAMGIR